MEILSMQNQYLERFSIVSNTTKTKDWSTYLHTSRNNVKTILNTTTTTEVISTTSDYSSSQFFLADEETLYCDKVEPEAVSDLVSRLLDELRAAKCRNLTCTEVSIPCDLTTRIALEIIRVSEREPCGIRGCTIYIVFEEEPHNSRRIGTLKVDSEMVSTFELFLTLRPDKRGWTSLLPQFMKNLSRSITISPEFSLTKHKLYSPNESS